MKYSRILVYTKSLNLEIESPNKESDLVPEMTCRVTFLFLVLGQS